ncbi:MAG TPA: hypothetical protein VMR21_11095 [Vicinamibacteria bacterium]|nr:hypothetical protein [Vicinamibacteria bacterium]
MAREGGEAERSAARRSWPIRVFQLGEDPSEDLSATTSVAERLAMMWPLALEAWSLSGRPLPSYARGQTPVSTRPSRRT